MRFLETNDILHDIAGVCEGRYDLDYLGMESLIDSLFDLAIDTQGTLVVTSKLTEKFFMVKFFYRMNIECRYFSYQQKDLTLILKIDLRQYHEDLRYLWCKKLDDYRCRIKYYADNEAIKRREDEEEFFPGAFADLERESLHINESVVDLTETEIEEMIDS